MATGSDHFPRLAPVPGLRLGAASAGIKTPGRLDTLVMELAAGTRVAAVFTRNVFRAAPVLVAEAHLASRAPRYLLVNTGNANAGNGAEGMEDARSCCRALAELTGCDPESVLPFSTGVIGEKLPVEPLVAALPEALEALSSSAWESAARAILTTDTRPKGATRRVPLGDREVVISGIAKGSGMICPNMATMLAYVATDADIAQADLQHLLQATNEHSFNRISVDGDTSTNDACVLLATAASNTQLTPESPHWAAFAAALEAVMRELAQAVVRDGEGATKFVSIRVTGAASRAEALDVAYNLAHSPLVKTALFASDPNWGRILAVVGRSSVPDLDLDALRIYLGDACIVSGGGRDPGYTEAAGQAAVAGEDIRIRVDLGRGSLEEEVWTTDLSHDYVSINADYRS